MKLCNISGKTLTCGKFLESLTTDKIACIDALVDASELTDWISSKGMIRAVSERWEL